MASDSRAPTRDDKLIDAVMQQCAAARAARPRHAGSTASSATLDARTRPLAGVALRVDSIAGYELLGERHRGGQGVVYEAIQLAAERRVAIKTLRAGPQASAAQRQRFEREVEILSQFQHPNIVTIYDSGLYEGWLYYVMELIDGQPLDEWSLEFGVSSLDSSQRGANSKLQTPNSKLDAVLRLFTKICDAVNAAHLRGVIHRDLKPGNILIDVAGEPHVLDFGLAKLKPGLLDDHSGALSVTEDGQFVGSLLWSSPEQSSTADQVDTRTDVYALGVLMYHALTGRFPFHLTGSAADVVARIRSAEPLRMNESVARAQTAIAERPGVQRGRLAIDDELETIVLKCLQKDPQRRYQTAGGLRDDLLRYLNHEPIEAKRDSFTYVLRKHLRRHRFSVAAISSVLAAGAIALGVSLAFWRQAEQQRATAEREADRARTAEQLAQRRLSHAQTASRLLRSMFGVVSGDGFSGRDVTVQQMLDNFAEDAVRKVAGQPELESTLRDAIADAYLDLGAFELAEPHVHRAFALIREVYGENHVEFAGALNARATLRHAQGKLAEAEQDYRASIAICSGDDAQSRSLRPRVQYALAHLLQETGRAKAAESLLREAWAVLRETPSEREQMAVCMRSLAMVLEELGRRDEAEPLFIKAIEILAEESGDSSHTAAAWNDYAAMLNEAGRPTEAIAYYEKALAVFQRTSGDESPRVATALGNLGTACHRAGLTDRAREYLSESLARRRRILPDGHLDIATGAHNLAKLHESVGELAPATALFRESLSTLTEHLPPNHPRVLTSKWSLARMLLAQRESAEVEPLVRDVLAERRKTLPPDHPEIASMLAVLGGAAVLQERFADAEPPLREALNIRRKALPAGHWLIAQTQSTLGEALLGLGRPDEARELLLTGFEGLRSAAAAQPAGVGDARLREACERIVRYYESIGDAVQAAEWGQKLESLP